MRTFEDIREEIEDLEELIEIAEIKRDKYLLMAHLWNRMDGVDHSIRTGKVKEFLSEYDRLTDLIDESKVEIEDLNLIIERIESKFERPSIQEYIVLIDL